MVQMKGRVDNDLRKPQTYFNSTMVQMKVWIANENPERSIFQFHDGTNESEFHV